MGFDPYREEKSGPQRFDKIVAATVIVVVIALIAWAILA